jgi:2-dehydropantoate 2-reductase
MHHAILGPGGVGGLIGACLGRSGESVTVVVRPEALRQYPDYLRLDSPFGNFTVPVRRAAKVPPSDVLWITVKATQLEVALRSLPGADAAQAIVPLLNGVDHIALLRERYGTERVVPATIAGETERVAPGHIVHRAPFMRLNVSARGRQQLGGTLGELQRIGFTCQFIEDEPTLMWSKLVFLAPLALTTSAAGATTGEVVADPHWRAELESCLREACAVATAEGAKVDAEATLLATACKPRPQNGCSRPLPRRPLSRKSLAQPSGLRTLPSRRSRHDDWQYAGGHAELYRRAAGELAVGVDVHGNLGFDQRPPGGKVLDLPDPQVPSQVHGGEQGHELDLAHVPDEASIEQTIIHRCLGRDAHSATVHRRVGEHHRHDLALALPRESTRWVMGC